MDKDLYDLPKEGAEADPDGVRLRFREALESLDKNRAFLKNGGVFDDDFIDSYIELKMTEVERFEMTPASGRIRHVLFAVIFWRRFRRQQSWLTNAKGAPNGAPFVFCVMHALQCSTIMV